VKFNLDLPNPAWNSSDLTLNLPDPHRNRLIPFEFVGFHIGFAGFHMGFGGFRMELADNTLNLPDPNWNFARTR
jgi:hypothetical protein